MCVFSTALATNMCFNTEDGQCSQRSDLIDAPTCALARGAPILGLGMWTRLIHPWEACREVGKGV